MKLRLAKPDYVIDIDPLADALGYISEHADHVRIGAMTRHNALLESPTLQRRLPIFTDAERVIADPVVRNRGTIGGALCQADPSEDLSRRLRRGRRAAGHPQQHGRARGRHGRVPPRPVRDRGRPGGDADRDPRADAPALRQRVPEGRPPGRRLGGRGRGRRAASCEDGAIARRRHRARRRRRRHHGAARPRPRWSGERPSDAVFARAAELASSACEPVTDQRGSADYKRHVVGVLTERVLRRATERAQQMREV